MKTIKPTQIGKYLSDTFPIQNGLKQGNALSQLLLMFAFECVIRKIQENQKGLKLNGTHQLMTYVDDVNLASENTYNVKKITEGKLSASKDVDLEVNVEKRHTSVSHEQNEGQNHNVMIINKEFENVANFKHFGMLLTL